MGKISVFIVDDHQVVLDGLSSMLEQAGEINLVGQAMNGPDALDFMQKNKVDVAIIDINLPGMDGIELCQNIFKSHSEMRVLALTTYNEISFITNIMKCGASGYLLKNTTGDELITAIKTAYEGEQYLSKEVKKN